MYFLYSIFPFELISKSVIGTKRSEPFISFDKICVEEQLSNKEKENTKEKQDDINKSFDKIKEDLKDLVKENKSLKSLVTRLVMFVVTFLNLL